MTSHGSLHHGLQRRAERRRLRVPHRPERSDLHAKLIGLLASVSRSVARRQPVGPLLARVLDGVLEVAGVASGALVVRLVGVKVPLIVSRGLRPDGALAIQSLFADHPAVSLAGPTRTEIPDRLAVDVAALEDVRSATIAPLGLGDAGQGALILTSAGSGLADMRWQSFTMLMAAQIGQALSLGLARGQLDASERLYRAVMDNTNDGVFVLDREGAILESNARATALLQRPGELVVGDLFADYLGNEAGDASRRHFTELLRAGNLHGEQLKLRRPDGGRVEVDISACNLQPGTEGAAVMAITHDVTQRNRLEEQLCQWQKMDAMGGLAASVSHDFNNILAVILGHASLLLIGIPEGDARRIDVLGLKAGADRGVALVRTLLDFTRMSRRDLRGVAVNRTIRELVPLLRGLLGPTVQIVTTLEARPGDITGDTAQIEQVVMNLAVNARDAMPGGGQLYLHTSDVELKNVVTPSGQSVADGSYLLLSVRDTGAGMDAATQKRVFDPFFTTKPAGQGTGLGLSTCQMILNRCHGFMTVDSVPAGGTTFRCYFPR